MSDFDRDLAGLSEEEGEDAYFAQSSPTGKKAGTGAATDDDEDELDDQPSVEEELAKKEAGHFDEKAGEKKKKKEAAEETEDTPKSDLDFIEEAAEEVEAERDELFAQDEEEI